MNGKRNKPQVTLEQRIVDRVRARDRFLDDVVKEPMISRAIHVTTDIRFLIGRKWNSWYPSYFKVDGGCYALVLGGDFSADTGDAKVIVIDPGFRFLEILRAEFDIQPEYVDIVIVTHYHPDHMAGLIEYATLRKKLGRPCDIFLNSTTYSSYSNLGSEFTNVHCMEPGLVKRIAKRNNRAEVYLELKPVHHAEIGNCHNSLGLIFDITIPSADGTSNNSIKYSIGILGDTDGHEKYLDEYMEQFAEVDLLVLHLGTFNDDKYGQGDKHLYIKGTRSLLECFKAHYSRVRLERKKVVVLSEFGLELGTYKQILEQLSPYVEISSWRLPLIFAKHYVEREQRDYKTHLDVFAGMCFSLFERSVGEGPPNMERHLVGVVAGIVNYFMGGQVNEKRNFSADVVTRIEHMQNDLGFLGEEDFATVLRKADQTLLEDLDSFFDGLLRHIVFSRKKTGKSAEQDRRGGEAVKTMASFATQLLIYTAQHLKRELHKFIYMPLLGRQERFERSLGLVGQQQRPYWWRGDRFNYKHFLGAAVIGCLRLLERSQGFDANLVSIAPEDFEEDTPGNTLVQIGQLFQKGNEDWCVLLTGDMGTKFRLCKDAKRIEIGVTQPDQASEECWKDPVNVEMFYNSEAARILYRRKQTRTE